MKHNHKHGKRLQIAFIMDAMGEILLKWDTSIAIMMEAQKRRHKIFYVMPDDLFLEHNTVYANVREVTANRASGFRVLRRQLIDLKTCDVIFNRKEPPFNSTYLYMTQFLELLEPDVFIINSPNGVRKANEKLYILEFPKWIPPTLVSNNPEQIESFQRKLKSDVILKPLDQKGGAGIRLLPYTSKKTKAILKKTTLHGTKWVMAQKFLKQNLTSGDKRILLLNGKVIGQFARIPKQGEFRANLSLGGKQARASLTSREHKLVRALRSKLLRDGLYFVGIDVVAGKLIEVNVTSPAGITEINELEGKHPEAEILDFLEERASRFSHQ